jgi:hypothetical protein
MTNSEIIFQQSSIIEEQAECIKLLSELAKDSLSLLAQYQTVDAEERRYSEIMKLSTFSSKEEMTNE